eukprot:TRINITY_DN2246_c0_g1_i1.p1 TRINITY_DN2246_c0_g1~~TRINITY_DN2246_c0_g1_i1.p1  ORF type:complete len:2283 (-),score=561.88 TRINITY_DN2246_c0_g1_i1:22-6870(-)
MSNSNGYRAIRMPPEHIRKIIRDNGDLSTRTKLDKRSYLGALPFLPLACLKLLENIPMPWETHRYVNVVYHKIGCLTIVNEVPRVIEPLFFAQWSSMWHALKVERLARSNFQRLVFPPFDDEEPIVDFGEHILNLDPPEPIELDSASIKIFQWFYDHNALIETNSITIAYKFWKLNNNLLSKLLEFSSTFVLPLDLNSQYLFNLNSFITAKSLNLVIPGGPKFEPLFKDDEYETDVWNEFNDLRKVIFRQKIITMYRIALPYLFNSRPRNLKRIQHSYPFVQTVKPKHDFTFSNDQLHPIQRRDLWHDDNFVIKPLSLKKPKAFGSNIELADPYVSTLMIHAPKPFDRKKNNTKRAQDVSLVDSWLTKHITKGDSKGHTRVAHQRLNKGKVLRSFKSRDDTKGGGLIKEFSKSPHFEITSLDWVEAGLQVLRQGHNMLRLVLAKKNLNYLHLDYNFVLKQTRTLKTKERKSARVGNSFHLIREILRFMKLIVDAHVKYRLGHIDSYQLADALSYLFNHVGEMTGVYRYKYKTNHQVRECKDLQLLIDRYFTSSKTSNVKEDRQKPGIGFWHPLWRVWFFWLRGLTPLLRKWLGNLISRMFEGRDNFRIKAVNKQREESNFDIQMRSSLTRELLDILPEEGQKGNIEKILQHLSEAWRCWRADIPWRVEGMPDAINALILRYVKLKADWYTSVTYFVRERLRKNESVENTVFKKNTTRVGRLYLREESQRQERYLKEGPFLHTQEAIGIYKIAIAWFSRIGLTENKIEFPQQNYRHDTHILLLALERLKDQYLSKSFLNQKERKELGELEKGFDDPTELLGHIKRYLSTQRVFRNVEIDFIDHFSYLEPIYDVDILEKIVDAYLDQYLWFEASNRNLFPNWIKPCDDEIAPQTLFNFLEVLANKEDLWEPYGQTVLIQTKVENSLENCDLNLLNKLLKLCIDDQLSDYLTSRNNVNVNFKDMNYTSNYGIIKGLQFSSFLIQYWYLIVDLMILGVPRAFELSYEQNGIALKYGQFENIEIEKRHPLRQYLRFLDNVYLVYKFDKHLSNQLCSMFKNSNYPLKSPYINRAWPKDERMRFFDNDVILAKATFWNLLNSLPNSIGTFDYNTTLINVFSKENSHITFEFQGFEVRFVPAIRMFKDDEEAATYTWTMKNIITAKILLYVWLKVSQTSVKQFESNVRTLLLTSGSTTFTKIASRWNVILISLVAYFREAITNTNELLETIIRCETKIQNRIKSGVNSKMPDRFPPVVFYAPRDLGGLEMLSAGHILIPQSDLKYRLQTTQATTHFINGMSSSTNEMIPTLINYITRWDEEFTTSIRIWKDYNRRRQIANQSNHRLTVEDLEGLWDRGIPRINTLFQRDRNTLIYDKGYRVRKYYLKYWSKKREYFDWTNYQHDGKLWNLDLYREDVIESLGGIESILEHSMYKGTGFKTWDGLFWQKGQSFEDLAKIRKLTNAQRKGLNQIPNRKFTFWWSPTINRADVYIGYQVQLDATGILMHGKLQTLKTTYIQLFKGHWANIHSSLVLDVCRSFDSNLDLLEMESVEPQQIHPRKSFKLHVGAADVICSSSYKWFVSKPSSINQSNDTFDHASCENFWIDIQLRYGNYDNHDIDKYAKVKFMEYTHDMITKYPCEHGLMIAVDLCYNSWSAYGHWFRGLKVFIENTLKKLFEENPALNMLRERIRNSLQLSTSKLSTAMINSGNFTQLFENAWIVDDSHVYRKALTKSFDNRNIEKTLNGFVTMFNAKTGSLILSVVHSDTFIGQKRVGQLSHWKAAEEIIAQIRSIDENLPNGRPNSLVILNRPLIDPLQAKLIDLDSIKARGSSLDLPFKSLLKVPRIADCINSAKNSQRLLTNLYDDWPKNYPPNTCFIRAVLLLRSLHISIETTKRILKVSDTTMTKPNHLWPSLTNDEWISVEGQLKDLILLDYSRKKFIDPRALTPSEVRDIILGMELSQAPSDERQKVVEAMDKSTSLPAELTAVTTRTVTKDGEEIITTTTSNFEKLQMNAKADWRKRAIQTLELQGDFEHFEILTHSIGDLKVIFPKNIIEKLLHISDVRVQIGGFLYGEKDNGNDLIVVKAVVIPLQWGSQLHVVLPEGSPDSIFLEDLLPLGWVRICSSFDHDGSLARDLGFATAINHCKLTQAKNNWDPLESIIISITGRNGTCQLKAHTISQEGFKWGISSIDESTYELSETFSETFARPLSIEINKKIPGMFLIPSLNNGSWNVTFNNSLQDPFLMKKDFSVQPGIPKDFYDHSHRILHFHALRNLEKVTKLDTEIEDFFN